MEQFVAAKEHCQWDAPTFERESTRFAEASVLQFNANFGHRNTEPRGWRLLCEAAGFDVGHEDVDICKAARPSYLHYAALAYGPLQLLRTLEGVDVLDFVEASIGNGRVRPDSLLLIDSVGITDLHGLARQPHAGYLLQELACCVPFEETPGLAPSEDHLQTSTGWEIPYVEGWGAIDNGWAVSYSGGLNVSSLLLFAYWAHF